MSMNPDPQGQQRPGLFARIGNFFGAGDPNAGTPTDPFADLSRAQRVMLGFGALRDAAAALEGRDTSFFNEALGGFETARERERLRTQGQMQNQVGALQALAQIEQQIAFSQSLGMDPSPAVLQLRDMLTAQAMGGGMPAPAVVRDGATVPVPAGGGGQMPPVQQPPARQGVPQTGVEIDPVPGETRPYDGAPEVVQPAPAASPMDDLAAQEAAIYEMMRQRALSGAPTRDLEMQLQEIQRQRAALAEQAEEQEVEQAQIQQQAQRAETVVTPEIDAALSFLVEGYTVNDEGQQVPIFNPALTTRAGRLVSGALESPEYQSFAGALETLRVDTLIDTLQNVTAGALSDAEREAFSAAQGQLDPRNPVGTFRALMRMQQIAQDAMARAGRATQTAPTVTWD